ncbi:MAG: hypothetical protein J2P44_02615, partial [Candidatus Dormibacteraeota bacterium]|nr:hypothetical protein [Candidatus Dormibacteraeota bacterium]
MADSSADVTAATPEASARPSHGTGLRFNRFFTPPGSRAFDLVEWERRTAAITNAQGKVFFEQKDVEVPRAWSQLASNIVAQKYFWGRPGTAERETSVRQLVDRVVNTLVRWGSDGGYFATEQDVEDWAEDLRWLLVTQHASFNSPVWFNIGVPGRSQQASACFINSVEDTMESILDLAKTEGMLFKFGSGTGTNLSVLRSSQEALAGGGTASGPVSFMRGYDSFAGSIKSGGTTRRAAKMVILNADHPDILDFVRCKADEEKKAWALIEAGYDAGFNVPGGAYDSVQFQNANHSVRVTDGFMRALADGGDWTTHAVTDGRAMETMKAADLWKEMAEAAWVCGDPGVQFDSTIQSWNTVPNTGRINATNPCSEFVFVDDTACFAPETRISTPNGLRTVESLFRAQEGGERVLVTTELHSEHDHRRLTAHRPARVTKVGRKPVVKMTLADGRQVRVTGDHRFLTSDGWRRVDQLRIGQDRVELRQSGNAIAFNSSSEAVQRWRMFGWLTGDGVFNKDVVAFVFGPKERKQAMHVATNFNLLKAESAVGRPGLSLRESSVGTQANGVMQITCSRDSVVRTLEETYGFAQATAIDKDVPSEVHRVSEDLRVAYLQGLFSADGCIRYNRSGTEPEVMLASSSPRLLRSVQLMLSDLGITSRVRFTHPAGRKNPQGQLHIFNQQMRKFLALVGFPCSDEKRAMAGRVLNSAFAGVLKNPRASTVVSIEPDGIQTVYDVTEPITHSLIAEGMVAHNCNLLSLNLRKFQNQDATVNAERMKRAVDICFTAQEILVSNASYPTPRIAENSERLRPLGLGYANLGALLMSMGHAYDSPDGRAVAGAVTALMTGEAYAQSARMAEVKGPFSEFPKNREPMLGVMRKHQAAAKELPATGDAALLADAAREAWADAITLGERHGYR